MRLLLACLIGVLFPSSAFAQVRPTILVLGVGEVTFEVELTPAVASGQGYRLYAPETAVTFSALTVVCAAGPTTTSSTCKFPLSVFTLPAAPATLGFALTATFTAADGVQETPKMPSPFVLGRAGPAVGPKATPMSVRPKTP